MQNSLAGISTFFQEQWQIWPELEKLHKSLTIDKAVNFEVKHLPFWVYTLSHRKNSAIGGYRKILAGSPLEPAHLLPKQTYFPFLDGFNFMVNPFPIFNEHAIVCSAELRPQKVYGHLNQMLAIQSRIGPSYCVLYNGTASGASIPEHWHVHILPKNLFLHWENSPFLKQDKSLHFFDDGLRRGLRLQLKGNDKVAQQRINSLTNVLSEVLNFDESLINVFILKRSLETTDILIFLRKAHRHRYFPNTIDEKGILISPGVVDVLGHIVCSREDDLKTLTSTALEHIFEDIFIDNTTFLQYSSLLKN